MNDTSATHRPKPNLFMTRSLPGNILETLSQHFKINLNTEDKVLSKAEIIENIQGADALLCLLTDTIDAEVITAGSQLKVISNYAVGFNNIDVEAATKQNIPVCITPGILTETTADLTFALILSVARRIVESDSFTRQGLFKGWAPNLFLGSDVYGKTLGIIGMGRIGQAVAKRAAGFGMKVVYHSRTEKEIPHARQVSFEEILLSSDFLSLHCPLTPETRYLIDEEQLRIMKKTAFLINTTRGPVVNESALVKALETGEIAGAGLDVYEHEPKLNPGLNALNNVVLLPHIGSATYETRSRMANMAAENAILIFQGKQPHAIANPQVLKI